MKMKGPGRYKFAQGRNLWLLAKHAWLYSDLFQALDRRGKSTCSKSIISKGSYLMRRTRFREQHPDTKSRGGKSCYPCGDL